MKTVGCWTEQKCKKKKKGTKLREILGGVKFWRNVSLVRGTRRFKNVRIRDGTSIPEPCSRHMFMDNQFSFRKASLTSHLKWITSAHHPLKLGGHMPFTLWVTLDQSVTLRQNFFHYRRDNVFCFFLMPMILVFSATRFFISHSGMTEGEYFYQWVRCQRFKLCEKQNNVTKMIKEQKQALHRQKQTR